MRGLDIVAEAREWLDTPYRHQASAKGAGCDCRGLVFGVGVALALVAADHPLVAAADYRRIDPLQLIAGLRAVLDPVADSMATAAAGDVLLLIVANKAQHLAIMTGAGSMIHCYSRGPGKVIEVPIGKSRPVHSVWRFRGLSDVG